MVLLITSICYSADSIDEFIKDLNEAAILYQKNKYQDVIALLEKHSEIISFSNVPNYSIEMKIIEARSLLGDCYIRIGNFKKAFDVFQETNGATDYSDSYALYQTALLTLLFDDIYSINDIINGMEIYYIQPDHRLYTLLLSVMEKEIGKLTPDKIEAALKNNKDKIEISASGQALVDFLLDRINEDELLAKTDAENHDAIKYFIGLKNEKYSGSITMGEKYYIDLYNKSEDLYKWLAAKRLGLYGILISDYENYYSYGDQWVFVKSSSTLLGRTKPYHVKEIKDNDPKTAWVEGKADDGIGEWVEFTYDPPVILERISVINGYMRSETLYYANNRVKKIRISFDDGTHFDQVLKDGELKPQIITLPEPKQAGKVRLTILETYKGSKYNDTCISEIIFDYSPLPEPEITPAEETDSSNGLWIRNRRQ